MSKPDKKTEELAQILEDVYHQASRHVDMSAALDLETWQRARAFMDRRDQAADAAYRAKLKEAKE